MKKIIFLFVFAIAFYSCRENMPIVPEAPIIDTARKVMVEEFTGVACVGCPSGSAELELLLSQYGENLVVVSIHTSDFGSPLPTSQYDFRTSEAEEIADYLGRPAAYPSAVVNRKDFNGGAYFLQSDKTLWSGFISQELEEDPMLTVNITKEFNATTRELEVRVTGSAEEELVGDLRLTIMITENNIIDAQDVENVGIVEDYKHKHVFRTTMTQPTGDPLVTNMAVGDTYDKTYTMTLSADWKTVDCEIIAFVNLIDGQKKEILQVESAHVED
jgi:hypothetical protein